MGESELCQLLGNVEAVDAFLPGNDVAEAKAVIENAEHDVHLALCLALFLQFHGQLII